MTMLSTLSRRSSTKATDLGSFAKSSAAAIVRGMKTASPSWATIDPDQLGHDSSPYEMQNLVDGRWSKTKQTMEIPHPLNKDLHPIYICPDTQKDEIQPFIDSLRKVPKSGMHNPLKNPERYLYFGEISHKVGDALSQPDIADWFAKAIQATVPKTYEQAMGEVSISRQFLKNFAGDNVRRLAKSFGVPGDHYGQMSVGHRWPYGPVALVSPFNFPLEIPVLQLMGALYMGNKPVLKCSEQVSLVMEQFLRLLHDCGMDPNDVDFLSAKGPVAQEVILQTPVRMTQFTGSSKVAEMLAQLTHGKVRLEDAGFDWKVIGPDVGDVDYVAWQCDQDANSAIGQKCSAQSIVFIHENWKETGLNDKMKALAQKRSLKDLTAGPTLTVTTKTFLDHTNKLASIPGAEIMWGGKELDDHNIPEKYGACEPTAVYVPLEEMMKDEHFASVTDEMFAPFQVITYFTDKTQHLVLEALERISHHLTGAIVSDDVAFQAEFLANTVNGTTYSGRRARTTGAPQNHWFGPAGDPRGAGIGTPEAIQLVWSCHREIISDNIVPKDWKQPTQS